ncbi:hypothetical protein ACF0H5_006243 [Mactra antiquata]
MTSKAFTSVTMVTCLTYLLCTSIVDAGDSSSLDTEDPCSLYGTGIYSHPLECQLFYNCSKNDLFEGHWKHLDECKYPDLFSLVTNKCERYHEVDCDGREEFVDACDYKQNQCLGPHCRPCGTRWPKCEVENGRTHYQYMIGSPYYGVCQDWRVVERKQCEIGRFNIVTKSCTIQSSANSV